MPHTQAGLLKVMALALALAVAGTGIAQEMKEEAKPLFPEAKPLAVETLGAPVRTMPVGESTWVPNPDGKGWTRLLFYYHYTMKMPCQFVAINTATGQLRQGTVGEKAAGAPWRYTLGRDGKCYMGVHGPTAIWIYDPATVQIEVVPVNLPGAKVISAIATGTDGMIYASTTGQIITFQLDPATRTITSYGAQGSPRKYLSYGYTVAADDEYTYTAAGKIPWELVAYHRKTGQQKILLTASENDYMAVGQGPQGCTALVSHQFGPQKGQTERYWLHRGEVTPQKADAAPPWGTSAPATKPPPAAPRPEELLDDAVPGADGKARYLYRLPEARAQAPKDPPPDADLAQLGWQTVEYAVQVGPGNISFIRETPDGRVLGVGPAYLDWFLYDPQTGRLTVLGKIPLSHYDTVFAGTKAYMMGYPTTPLYEYDLTGAWTPGTGTPQKPAPQLDAPASNPRRVAYLGHTIMTHHGRAGAVGADGRIYVGGHAERAHVGGGLAWWDPKERKAGGLREPFELFDIASLCAVDDGRKIVYSSTLVTDPATGKREPAAKLFLFDTEKQELAGSFAPFAGRNSTGRIVPAGGTTVVGAIGGGEATTLYRADVAAQKVLQQVELPSKLGGDFRLGPDGHIWAFADKVLVRIDPQTLEVTPIGTVEAAGRMAFIGRDLYLAGQAELRRVTGALK